MPAGRRRPSRAGEDRGARTHVDVIDTPAGLAALKESWEAVYDADLEAQLFLSWTWMRAATRMAWPLGRLLLVERLKRAIHAHGEKDIVVYTSQHTAGSFARFGFETSHVMRDRFAPGLDLHRMRIDNAKTRSHCA